MIRCCHAFRPVVVMSPKLGIDLVEEIFAPSFSRQLSRSFKIVRRGLTSTDSFALDPVERLDFGKKAKISRASFAFLPGWHMCAVEV